MAIKSKTKNSYFSLYCLLITPVFFLVHSLIPFERTWPYLIVPLVFLLGFCLNLIPKIKRASPKHIVLISLSLIIGLGILFNNKIDHYNFAAFTSGKVGNYFFDNNARKIISNHFMLRKDVQFLYENRGESIEFTDLKEPLTQELIQSIKKDYDFLVTTEKPEHFIGLHNVQYWGNYYQGKKIYTIKRICVWE